MCCDVALAPGALQLRRADKDGALKYGRTPCVADGLQGGSAAVVRCGCAGSQGAVKGATQGLLAAVCLRPCAPRVDLLDRRDVCVGLCLGHLYVLVGANSDSGFCIPRPLRTKAEAETAANE